MSFTVLSVPRISTQNARPSPFAAYVRTTRFRPRLARDAGVELRPVDGARIEAVPEMIELDELRIARTQRFQLLEREVQVEQQCRIVLAALQVANW